MTDRHSELVGIIQNECVSARAFVAILEREKDALSAAAVDELAAITEEKSTAARDLAQLSEARHRAVRALGYTGDAKGTRAWLQQSGNPGAVRLWRELDLLAWKAREANRLNGAMIATWLQHNQRALAVLRGASASASLYDARGVTPSGALSRSLAQA